MIFFSLLVFYKLVYFNTSGFFMIQRPVIFFLGIIFSFQIYAANDTCLKKLDVNAINSPAQVVILGKSFPNCGSFKTTAQIYWETLIDTIGQCQRFEAEILAQDSYLQVDPLMVNRDKYGFSMLENKWLNAYRNLPHKGGPTIELRQAALKDLEHAQLTYVKEAEKINSLFVLFKQVDECEHASSSYYHFMILKRFVEGEQVVKEPTPISPAFSVTSATLSDSVTSVNEAIGDRRCSSPIPINKKDDADFGYCPVDVGPRKLRW